MYIKQNAWIGAGATILPGVTVGENVGVAAGGVVNRHVPPNTVVAGIPAKSSKTMWPREMASLGDLADIFHPVLDEPAPEQWYILGAEMYYATIAQHASEQLF